MGRSGGRTNERICGTGLNLFQFGRKIGEKENLVAFMMSKWYNVKEGNGRVILANIGGECYDVSIYDT
ncbi:MAG: hypothetical protein HFI79_11745 [Lachnospiraceae bacterium]|jgi:hypothetical protein|nr:hypothetical protein [Lachnospiraceae bacterium]